MLRCFFLLVSKTDVLCVAEDRNTVGIQTHSKKLVTQVPEYLEEQNAMGAIGARRKKERIPRDQVLLMLLAEEHTFGAPWLDCQG